MATLARAVEGLGHSVVLTSVADAEPLISSYGIAFEPLAPDTFPPGETTRRLGTLSRLSGAEALQYTIQWLADTARAQIADGPRVLKAMRADALVCDQVQTGLNLVALEQNVPYVHVSNALHLDYTGRVPLCAFPWPYEDSDAARARNLEGLKGFGKMLEPIAALRRETIVRNKLPVNPDSPYAGLSPRAWITQCPREFDFPGDHLPKQFHYAGPFHSGVTRPQVNFPWDRLTGEPLIYASMGTLQNGSEAMFQAIVDAAERKGHQLVLAIGHNLDREKIVAHADNTVIVHHAPQLRLLERATLCITHAGLNTALEALSAGVPMVAIPVANDQHGVGARIQYTGCGQVVPLAEVSPERLRQAIQAVLFESSYQENARQLATAIRKTDGLNHAARLITDTLTAV
jgi:zeaxanthin glucosyltransferase